MSHDCDMLGVAVLLIAFGLCFSIVLAKQDVVQSSYFAEAADLLLLMRPREWLRAYTHVWPEMEFGWKIVVGTLIGFFGSGFGTVGGVGGGGIFVPMLTLIIGFDSKTSIAISKCMITGGAAATVYYNLKRRHPTLDLPLIDYDLALLVQPVLVLGISIGVTLNVILAEWMITVLLIILFLGTSTKAFLKGIELWKKETLAMIEAESRRRSDSNDDAGNNEQVEYQPLPEQPDKETKVSVIRNVRWRELAILFTVWAAILALQIVKDNVTTCSVVYWVVNLSQIPVAVGASTYETVMLYKGNRVITSRGDGIDGESGSTSTSNLRVGQLVMYCLFGLLAGIVGGLLGLGGGFILGPLFLELGIPPQVSSATATFAMTFSASMSAVEYYLLKRFPLPYTLYFVAVATVAALAGQYVVRRLIVIIGRASLIIFILAFTIFVSAISLGGVGILDMIDEIKNKEYMGFESLCSSS